MDGHPMGFSPPRLSPHPFLDFPELRAHARVVELVDTTDLNSVDPNGSCGFKSRPGYIGTDAGSGQQ